MKRYRIEPARSRFTVQAFAGGLLSVLAHSPTFAVRSFAGEIRLEDSAQSLTLDLTIEAGSLELVDRASASDRREIERRMRDEVLEIGTYPEIACRAAAASARETGPGRYQLSLKGDLTLHGVTRPRPMEAELIVFADGLRLGGRDTLRMSTHGIRPVTAVGGTINLKDELAIIFDIAALPVAT